MAEGDSGNGEGDFNDELDSCESRSHPWWGAEQDAQIVLQIGADIARRYANRGLRPGFDANAVELHLEGLASELLTNESALEALKPENADWLGKVKDWARRAAAHFAIDGWSPFPESMVVSCRVEPFVEIEMARYLVIAWTALGGELLGDFLRDIARRGNENRDRSSPHRLQALICRAVTSGDVSASEIQRRIEPYLRVNDLPKPPATGDLSKLTARDKADEERKRLKDRIRKIVARMRRDPGKVRGQVKAEDFGFSTSTDSNSA